MADIRDPNSRNHRVPKGSYESLCNIIVVRNVLIRYGVSSCTIEFRLDQSYASDKPAGPVGGCAAVSARVQLARKDVSTADVAGRLPILL